MAGSPALRSLFQMMDRQGLLRGDLSLVQRTGLQFLMNQEIEDRIELERIRTENMALASNPATSGEFLKYLFDDKEAQEVEQWVTPKSTDEIEEMLSGLS